MEDQDCHPSTWKRCHWHPEAAGQGPWMRLWLGCGPAAPSATSWLLQSERNRTGKLRHGAVTVEWSHLMPRDEQLHPTEAGNTHPLIPSGCRSLCHLQDSSWVPLHPNPAASHMQLLRMWG